LGLAAAGALVVWIAAARFAARRFRALSGGRS